MKTHSAAQLQNTRSLLMVAILQAENATAKIDVKTAQNLLDVLDIAIIAKLSEDTPEKKKGRAPRKPRATANGIDGTVKTGSLEGGSLGAGSFSNGE
jgi:hypothetical protein